MPLYFINYVLNNRRSIVRLCDGIDIDCLQFSEQQQQSTTSTGATSAVENKNKRGEKKKMKSQEMAIFVVTL